MAVALTAALLPPAGASESQSGAVTLGPDLSAYSDTNQVGCSSNPFTGAVTGALSCTWASVYSSGPQQTLMLTGPGQISQITVKVGAITGPMKAVVMRGESSFSLGESEPHSSMSCCTDIAESQTFTPAANSTTPVAVELPVALEELSPNPQTLSISYAYVGLSVSQDGLPVPAATGVHETIEVPVFSEGPEEEPIETGQEQGFELAPSTLLEEPAMQPSGQPQTPQIGKGVLVLLDATFTPTPGATTIGSLLGSHLSASGPPGIPQSGNSSLGPTPTVPGMTVGFPIQDHGVHVIGHDAFVKLTCTAASSCAGTVRLQSAPGQSMRSARPASAGRRRRGHKHKSGPFSYGKGSFKLAAGSSASVPVRLSAAGERLARKHWTLKIWVKVSLATPKPAKAQSGALTLRF